MNSLIIDDDLLICDMLQHFCDKVDAIDHVTVANSGLEAVNLISQNSFDVIFLDFHLPDITGKEILEVIPPATYVVMITSNTDFGHESYNYEQIIDFLVKPLDFIRFARSINKIKNKRESPPSEQKTENLFVKEGNDLIKVNLEKVLYIKSSANYAQLVFKDRKLMTLMTLKELEQKLPDFFQRIHRSTIVNINMISSISKNKLQVEDESLSISETYSGDLLKRIQLLS